MSAMQDAITNIDNELDGVFSLFSLSEWQDCRVCDAIGDAAINHLPEAWEQDHVHDIAFTFGRGLQKETGFTVPSRWEIQEALFNAMKECAL